MSTFSESKGCNAYQELRILCVSPLSEEEKMMKNLPKARKSKVEHQPKLSLKQGEDALK